MDPKKLLQAIAQIVLLIQKEVAAAKINQAQCEQLYQRIAIISKYLQTLSAIPNTAAFLEVLQALELCSRKCLVFIQRFTATDVLETALKAAIYQSTFESFSRQLDGFARVLNIGLVVQQKQDLAAQEADCRYLRTVQGNILDWHKQQLQQGTLPPSEQERLVTQQLQAVEMHLTKMCTQQSPIKPPVDSHHYIPFYDLTLENEIRKEALGAVYFGYWHKQPVAIKLLEGALADAERQQFVREVQIMSRIKGKHILQFYGTCLEPKTTCMVMEHTPNGSLYEVLSKKQKLLTPQFKLRLALEIAQGLQSLHQQRVIHGDLSSNSIFFDADWHVKLAGFRLARVDARSILSLPEQQVDITAWLAPELFALHAQPTDKSDVYSYGMILWELVTQKQPYALFQGTTAQLAAAIQEGGRETIPEIIMPPVLKSIIVQCWQQDSAKRPTLEEIIQQLETCQLQPDAAAEEIYQQGKKHEAASDYKSSGQCYQQAASMGHYKALTNLGLFYSRGTPDLAKDQQKAATLFWEAAQSGHARAQYNLALMYEKGIGVKKDVRQALYWYEEAAKLGDAEAQKKLEHLFALLLQESEAKPELANELEFNVISRQDLMLMDESEGKDEKKTVPEEKEAVTTVHAVDLLVGTTASYQLAYAGLHMIQPLGKGSFGAVYKGMWQGSDVAIKILHAVQMTEQDEKDFKREVAVMANLHHGHVVQLYGFTLHPEYSMVMEFCPNGSLDHILHGSYPLPWDLRYRIAADVASGLWYLHDRNIIHADIKSTNVLLDERMRAKLSDFGLSRIKSSVKTSQMKKDENIFLPLRWVAPELFKLVSKPGRKSDMYSFGMLLWEIAARQEPFHGESMEKIASMVAEGEHEKIPDECQQKHPSFAALITACWDERAEKRPTAEQAFAYLQQAIPAEHAPPVPT